jgi:hypothetical protein
MLRLAAARSEEVGERAPASVAAGVAARWADIHRVARNRRHNLVAEAGHSREVALHNRAVPEARRNRADRRVLAAADSRWAVARASMFAWSTKQEQSR